MRSPSRRAVARVLSHLLVAIPLVAAVGFIAWRSVGASGTARGNDNIAVVAGDALPTLTVADPAGRLHPLAELVAGGPASLHVVDPACIHCKSELRHLEAIVARPDGVVLPRIVVVAVGDPAGIRTMRALHPGLTIFHDRDDTLVRRYRLTAVPVLMTVDARGRLLAVRGGLQSERSLRNTFAALTRP